jgi:hypothetical protein
MAYFENKGKVGDLPRTGTSHREEPAAAVGSEDDDFARDRSGNPRRVAPEDPFDGMDEVPVPDIGVEGQQALQVRSRIRAPQAFDGLGFGGSMKPVLVLGVSEVDLAEAGEQAGGFRGPRVMVRVSARRA